jgi:deoxycytidylate deaminase
MSEAARKEVVPMKDLFISSDTKSSRERVHATHTQELVFALCGYMGSNIKAVADSIEFVLENDYGYKCERIKLAKFIELNRGADSYKAKGSTEYVRVKNLIEDGNKLRSTYGNEILAELAIQKIGLARIDDAERVKNEENKDQYQFRSRKICYIIESLKNPDELKILKEVYRNLLYFIGVFSPYRIRHENLRQKEITETEIAELINQDTHEEMSHGQDVRDTFTKADYLLRNDSISSTTLQSKIERFLHLIFGTEIITPTKDETAMYFASSAAANSACLSRQVGASIVDANGDIISIGWNDVPCYMGNLYKHQTSSDIHGEKDFRCLSFQDGKCMNDEHKSRISIKLLDDLLSKNLVKSENKSEVLEVIKSSRLGSLIEFSRAIHAEMHAIIIGSQKSGDKIVGGKLFCTTYPCHNCARHIVLAGITEVYFIEPYSKSLATILHSDSITDDENESNKVKILLYDGVSPNRYMQLFKVNEQSRKNKEGKVNKQKQKDAFPKFTETLEALYTLESTATKNLKDLNLKLT